MSDAFRPPRWPLVVMILVLLVGTGISAVMTWHHEIILYGGEADAGEMIDCSTTDEVSCDLVNTSEYSEFVGVPIATWGIATYLVLAGLALAALRGRPRVLWLLIAGGVASVLYSAFLFYISKVVLDYLCTWCIRLYVVNGATLALALLARAHRAPRPQLGTVCKAALAFALLSAVSIGLQRTWRASLVGDAADVELVEAEPQAHEERDPEGTPPPLSFEVKTEDGNDAILTIQPDDAWRGNPEATVAIVEFYDFQCGYCKRVSAQIDRLFPTYRDRVLFVSKHFPVDPACNPGVRNRRHRDACQAARAAVCAQEQGLYWAFHSLTFKNAHQLDDEDLRLYAEKVGADMGRYDACMASPASLKKVRDDGEDGKALDLHGTPRIFINGKRYQGGQSAEQFARGLELALGARPDEAARAVRAIAEESVSDIEPIPADVPPAREITHDGLSFTIDTFEAALRDGRAVIGKHEIPANGTSWYAAREACAAAGRRLCSEQEWLAACQGAVPVDDDDDGQFGDDMVEGTAYPYGDYHDRRRCWDGKDRDQSRPVYTGEMPGCVSRDGVYDLTGNVEEWVGLTPETAVLMGGAYDTSKDHARCYRRNDTYGAGFANARTGFRCCGELPSGR